MTNKTTMTRGELVRRIFNDFAMDTTDVAALLGVKVDRAYRILRDLESDGMLCSAAINGHEPMNRSLRGKMNPGLALTWQTWRTTDEGGEEVIAEYLSAARDRGVDLDKVIA